MLLDKQKRRELLKEPSYKKLDNSRRWRELYQEQLNKKSDRFQKKYELRKRMLDLETHKLEKKRRTRLMQNTLQNRLAEIEKSIQLWRKLILVYSFCHFTFLRSLPSFLAYLPVENIKCLIGPEHSYTFALCLLNCFRAAVADERLFYNRKCFLCCDNRWLPHLSFY